MRLRGPYPSLALLATVLAFAPSVHAQQAAAPAQPKALAEIYACAQIAEDPARLACFDAAVGALKSAQASGEFAAVDAAGVRRIEREAFGFSLPSLPRLGLPGFSKGEDGGRAPEQTSEVELVIDRVSRIDGREAFIMANGQIWSHIDSNTNRKARPGAKVTIRRAAMGSYLMRVEDGGAALRVRRLE